MLTMPYDKLVDDVMSIVSEVKEQPKPNAEAQAAKVKEVEAEAIETPLTPDETTTAKEPEGQIEVEAEADETDDDVESAEEKLRKLTEKEAAKEAPVQLSAEQELLLQEYQSKFSDPDNLVRHAVRQAQTSEDGIRKIKERYEQLLQRYRDDYPEFDPDAWKPNIDAKVRAEIAEKKGWGFSEVNEWIEENGDLFADLVEARLEKQRSEYEGFRKERNSQIEADLGNVTTDVTKRYAEKAAKLKKRFDRFEDKLGDDPILRSAFYSALSYEGEDAPDSDEQRFLDAQTFRDKQIAATLEQGRNLGKDVVKAALNIVLKDKDTMKMLAAAIKPGGAEKSKKVRQVVNASAGAGPEPVAPPPSSKGGPIPVRDMAKSFVDEIMAGA